MNKNLVFSNNDTICALATPAGKSAIAIIRVSGEDAISIISKFFKSQNPKKQLEKVKSHSLHFGTFVDNSEIIDEVLISVFLAPNTVTGENIVEISCHGSEYIYQRILEALQKSGCRYAEPGEFTFRSFKNGKVDLSQAEAVADLIDANNKTSHQNAIFQIRGGFSSKINSLRQELIKLMSLFELELDFSEEDVIFADRKQIINLINNLINELNSLAESFKLGNVIKNGIPVAIVGKPNVGKSTLLNALFNDEIALVSDIPGTTRDVIQDVIHYKGVAFRFFDTAGLRENSTDIVENMGIKKTLVTLAEAQIILYIFDATSITDDELNKIMLDLKPYLNDDNKKLILVGNKIDSMTSVPAPFLKLTELETIFISAKRNENINLIEEKLVSYVNEMNISNKYLVSNSRHYTSIINAVESLNNALSEIDNHISTDLIAVHLRSALHYLAEITGAITSEDIFESIFKNFCIGK